VGSDREAADVPAAEGSSAWPRGGGRGEAWGLGEAGVRGRPVEDGRRGQSSAPPEAPGASAEAGILYFIPVQTFQF